MVWSHSLQGQIVAGCAVGPGGEVIAATRRGEVAALSGAGEKLWSRTLPDGVYGNPAVAEGGLVFVSCIDRYLYALDLASGRTAWRQRCGRDLRSSVALAGDGRVLLTCWDYTLYCIAGGAGGPADSPWPQLHGNAARTGRPALKDR